MNVSKEHGATNAEEVTLTVWVTAGASRTRVGGRRGDALVVFVTAPAVEGAANKAVCRAVAESLRLRPRQVELVQGQTSRSKVLTVDLPAGALAERLRDLGEG